MENAVNNDILNLFFINVNLIHLSSHRHCSILLWCLSASSVSRLGDCIVAIWILRASGFDLFYGLALGFIFFCQVFDWVLPAPWSWRYSPWLGNTSQGSPALSSHHRESAECQKQRLLLEENGGKPPGLVKGLPAVPHCVGPPAPSTFNSNNWGLQLTSRALWCLHFVTWAMFSTPSYHFNLMSRWGGAACSASKGCHSSQGCSIPTPPVPCPLHKLVLSKEEDETAPALVLSVTQRGTSNTDW